MNDNNLMEKVVSLCKRRGFVFPGSEIYGGLANTFSATPAYGEGKITEWILAGPIAQQLGLTN